ncbi:GSCFA domain-containing protein [Bowmanella pacifica]|uniref:GSCFA domain-containing protein n=1 Tax=Bowmanella pacifica TaxID=502051 RepID=A0A917Z5S0_9ALTE|nr:GSCFA domain-containing protein [Bowmanella pacifica]GGO73851.1 hypothetical protein GCM10010982_35340 [Bowmanella pacifica]
MKKMTVLEKHGFQGISRWPTQEQLRKPGAVADYFMNGYAPNEPLISKSNNVTAFGSCFAGNVSRYMRQKGYSVNGHDWDHNQSDIIRIDEIMVHTPALLMQFEWAFSNRTLESIFIGGAEEKIQTYHNLEKCRELIRKTDFFIITLGLTEAWYDKEKKQYLWKFVPNKKLNSGRFENRFVKFSENLENIKRIYNLIRANLPSAKILFTLSPIPLLGSYQGRSVISANTASKSTLKAALHEFLANTLEQDPALYYFPSYELINHYIEDPWMEDKRHLKQDAIIKIMEIFDYYYLKY